MGKRRTQCPDRRRGGDTEAEPHGEPGTLISQDKRGWATHCSVCLVVVAMRREARTGAGTFQGSRREAGSREASDKGAAGHQAGATAGLSWRGNESVSGRLREPQTVFCFNGCLWGGAQRPGARRKSGRKRWGGSAEKAGSREASAGDMLPLEQVLLAALLLQGDSAKGKSSPAAQSLGPGGTSRPLPRQTETFRSPECSRPEGSCLLLDGMVVSWGPQKRHHQPSHSSSPRPPSLSLPVSLST